MLYIGYLIILDGQNIRKISFGNFQFSAAKAGKLYKQLCIFEQQRVEN